MQVNEVKVAPVKEPTQLPPAMSHASNVKIIILRAFDIRLVASSLMDIQAEYTHITSDMALLKLIYLAVQHIQKKWTQPLQNWSLTVSQLSIIFGSRLKLRL